jgi:hypothetical protein
VFTDTNGIDLINRTKNNNTQVVLLEMTQFNTYKYSQQFIEYQSLINPSKDWRLNLIWNEKINFVKTASNIQNSYYYIWCDIGYFRTSKQNTPLQNIHNWPNIQNIVKYKGNLCKIHYGIIKPLHKIQ